MNIITRTLLALVPLLITNGCSNGNVSISDIKDGDLLFVVNGNGNNITNVTKGVDGLGIDHVAVFTQGNIIEAIPQCGVVENPLDSFLVRMTENEAVLVGRVKGLDVRESVANARNFLGKPYDDIFMPSDSAIYCSELVQKSFVFKRRNLRPQCLGSGGCLNNACKLVFGTIPMSFHDSTGNVTEFWTKFYASRGLTVPEGEPGTNPGQLSRDSNVEIIGKLSYHRSLRQAQ